MPLLCPLPHYPTGLPEGWGLNRLSRAHAVSDVWFRQFDGFIGLFLDYLSAEATRAGVCPNHVFIMRFYVARTFREGRETSGQESRWGCSPSAE